MTVFLMLLTTLAAVALLAVLVYYAGNVARTLEAIGANEPSATNRGGEPRSLLSRIWFGVRAIDTQVAALVPQATRLNENLGELAGGLTALKGALKGALDAVEAQAARSPNLEGPTPEDPDATSPNPESPGEDRGES